MKGIVVFLLAAIFLSAAADGSAKNGGDVDYSWFRGSSEIVIVGCTNGEGEFDNQFVVDETSPPFDQLGVTVPVCGEGPDEGNTADCSGCLEALEARNCSIREIFPQGGERKVQYFLRCY